MLPTCFLYSPPCSPTKLALRAGLEVEALQPTRRQCSGAVWRHWQTLQRSCQEALGQSSRAVRHWGSLRGPDHWASPTLMADLQLQQQDPVLRLVLAAWPAKPSNTMERSMWALVQQYPQRFLKNGILRCGQADQHSGTLEQLILPRSLWPDVQEKSGTTSAAERDALWCHALGKRKGIWCLLWSFGNALCLYVNGLP